MPLFSQPENETKVAIAAAEFLQTITALAKRGFVLIEEAIKREEEARKRRGMN